MQAAPPSVVDEAIRSYQGGESAGQIGRRLGITRNAVYLWLRRAGLPSRSCAVAKRLNYPCREDAFDCADKDPVAAYWVGMLMTDGSIIRGRTNCPYVTLGLQTGDRAHVEAFLRFLGATNNKVVVEMPRKPRSDGRFGAGTGIVKVSVGSHALAAALAKYGVVERKSLTAMVAGGLEDNPHFWRGCVDGDGSVAMRYVKKLGKEVPYVALCGSLHLVRQFERFVKAAVPCCKAKTARAHSIWGFRTSTIPAQQLVRVLYGTGGPALPRKLAVAQQVMAWQSERQTWMHLASAELEGLRSTHGSWRAAEAALGVCKGGLYQVRRRLQRQV